MAGVTDAVAGVTDAVAGVTDAVAITAGPRHFYVTTRDGGVACWGSGFRGQLGDGTARNHADARPVVLPAKAVAISAADDLSCARLADARLACWGSSPPGAPRVAFQPCHDTWLGELSCVATPTLVTLLP